MEEYTFCILLQQEMCRAAIQRIGSISRSEGVESAIAHAISSNIFDQDVSFVCFGLAALSNKVAEDLYYLEKEKVRFIKRKNYAMDFHICALINLFREFIEKEENIQNPFLWCKNTLGRILSTVLKLLKEFTRTFKQSRLLIDAAELVDSLYYPGGILHLFQQLKDFVEV